jgi:hypothetical protein
LDFGAGFGAGSTDASGFGASGVLGAPGSVVAERS